MRLPNWFARSTRMYVDAKILNMHAPTLPREAYVGYVVEGRGWRGAKRVEAGENDDAEILAILFAMDQPKGAFRRMTIVCDHESVVSEANREAMKNPNPLLERLRKALREEPSVELRASKANPAHKVVTEYVNETRSGPSGAEGS